MPTPVSVKDRSSSITNSFINGIIPARYPEEDEITEVLSILGMTAEDVRCAYCGDKSTEWDHFRPLIVDQEPTGYISEIQNLVPACSKCNQSKGNSHWRSWIQGSAKLSPRVRGTGDLDLRIARLEQFERWREPTKLNIPEIVGETLWDEYRTNWRELLEAMHRSHDLALRLRERLQASGAVPTQGHQRVVPVTVSTRRSPEPTEPRIMIQRVRDWASKPHLNVHRIIGIVVRAGGIMSRDQLVKEAARLTQSRNAYGAIASLLTTKGNAYGQVFRDDAGMISFHPEVEAEVRAHTWS